MNARCGFVVSFAGLMLIAATRATAVEAQASIEVVASLLRDGIDTPNYRQQVGIAEDGTLAFSANTAVGPNRLLLSSPGGTAFELGITADVGTDVGINHNSILFFYGPQVLALRSDLSSLQTSVVQDCMDTSTPCRGGRHLSMSSDGYFAITAFDSSGGIYRGRVSKGRLSTVLESVPIPAGFITALGIDVRVGGPMLLLGDHSASSAEVYGAFTIAKSRLGYLVTTELSTRPRGGSEAPGSAVYGGYQPLALMPAQTDGFGTTLATPALVRGAAQPYRTLQVRGTPSLALQSTTGGSMDANALGVAAVVATLPSGWAGLFTFDTANPGASPVLLTELNQWIGKCTDTAIALHVLGMNDAGQVAVLARVQSTKGVVDTQVWRVTPTPTLHTTTSYCLTGSRWPFGF